MKLPKKAPLQPTTNENITSSGLENNEIPGAPPPITEQNILIDSIDQYFRDEIIQPSETQSGLAENYWGSQYQRNLYEQFKNKDRQYEEYILKTYGSYDNFEKITNNNVYDNTFDPYSDFKMEVTIITKDKYYKSDHISPFQMIREMMYGICSVDFLRKNGQADKIIGTLYKKYIPPANIDERVNFFFPLRGNRIGIWNMIKQDWSSFYIANAIRFVRDDSTGLE